MHLFSAGKYDCQETVIVRTKLDIETGLKREKNHHSRLFNWHRPFFKCDCVATPTKKELCDSKMIWFDQGLWYMLTHLGKFFNEVGIAAKFMAFIHFLTKKAKDSVLDHITFLFIRELIFEACVSLHNDPLGPVLKDRMNTRSGIIIERLVKPAQFTEDLVKRGNDAPLKRRWDLNDNTVTQPDSNRRFTPRQFSSGYGRGDNRGNNHATYSQEYGQYGRGHGQGENSNWSGPGTPRQPRRDFGRGRPDGSPLQRQNIHFDH